MSLFYDVEEEEASKGSLNEIKAKASMKKGGTVEAGN